MQPEELADAPQLGLIAEPLDVDPDLARRAEEIGQLFDVLDRCL